MKFKVGDRVVPLDCGQGSDLWSNRMDSSIGKMLVVSSIDYNDSVLPYSISNGYWYSERWLMPARENEILQNVLIGGAKDEI